MGQIKTLTMADGSKRYRFTVETGRDPVTGKRTQRRYTFTRMKDAKREQARLTSAVHDGTFVDRSRETVDEMLDRYLRSACFERADNTRVSYANALQPVRERLGRRKLQSLTRADIEDLRDWMLAEGRRRGGKSGGPLGPAVGAAHARQAQGRAGDGVRGRPPGREPGPVRADAQSQPRREAATWSEAELRRFLAAADADRLAAAWRLTLYGLRRGEVCGLRWEDVDLDRRTVRIGRARVLVDGRPIVKAPKSERGYRTLPLDDVLAAALEALQARQMEDMDAAGPAYVNSGYVVADELGARRRRNGSPTSSTSSPRPRTCRGSACTTAGTPSLSVLP